MTEITYQNLSRRDLWNESRRIEEQGDFEKALEIHQQILKGELVSYATSLRAGWLHYKLDHFEESLRYYEWASVQTNDDWPWFGIMNCLVALGETDTLARVAESVYGSANIPAALSA